MNILSKFSAALVGGGAFFSPSALAHDAQKPHVEPNGSIHVPAFDLPESVFLSGESRAALKRWRDVYSGDIAATFEACPAFEGADMSDIPNIRKCRAEFFYKTALYQSVVSRYNVTITPKTISGVYVEIFVPVDGVAIDNKSRVLINLHGGGFTTGSRISSRMESIPICSVGKIKIISIDYRMGPEHRFPAASEDVVSVYRELLKEYEPENIGVYGSSAGAWLTAQAIARFLKEDLPLPGAVGMFVGGAPTSLNHAAFAWERSDGAYMNGALERHNYDGETQTISYFQGVDIESPLAAPGGYNDVMARFPPSVLITGTRDFQLSSVVTTHAQLTRLGVKADLHVFEGMEHFLMFNPEFPETREAYNVIVRFFDEHLGK
tara:strand:- start:17343 stop:18476 length:1134 start_codon:yes stop_codon:yes gene_type:complete